MGRPRKHPIISDDSASTVVIKGKEKGDKEAPTKGRKKRVATDKSLDETSRKRAKIEETANELPKTEQSIAQVATKTTRTRSTITVPKWKVVNVINLVKESESTTGNVTSSITTLSPRIWTGSREELLALLPELAGTKCFNGISWYKYPTPVVVLDDTNRCFEIERQATQPLCLDLVTTRSFVCPIPAIPAESTRNPAPSARPSSPSVTPQPASNFKIRKAPRYRVPKSLGKSSITAKVEYVPTAALSSMEPPFAHTNTPVTTSAPPAAVDGNFLQSTFSIAPHTMSTATLPPTPSASIPAASDQAPTREHKFRFLPRTWEQVGSLDKIIDKAHQISSMYEPTRVTSNPTAFRGEPSHLSNVSYRLTVQSSRSIPLASSSKLTLDGMDPSGGSSDSPLSSPPHSIPVTAQDFPIVGHIHPTISIQKSRAHLRSDLPASFELPSPQDSEKLTTAHTPHLSTMTNEAPNEATSTPKKAILIDTQQAAASAPPSVSFTIHETMGSSDLASPGTTGAGIVPAVEPEQTSVPIMMDETGTEMNLAAAGDILPAPRAEFEAAASSKAQDAINLDDFIPSQLPEEIASLIEAYLFSRPLSIMVSRDRLKESWDVEVKKEFGYVMLGFFRVLGLQEIRVKDEDIKLSKLANGICAGRVQWRFHLEWASGGEEIILPNYSRDAFDWPWWNEREKGVTPSSPSDTSTSSETEIAGILLKDGTQPDEPESRNATTARYRQARIANHEYQFRNCPLSEAYDSVLPEQVLAPFGRQHRDRVFPRGWLCTKCGRLNFQQALRQRKCPSSMCRDEPPPVDPYFYDLYSIRDPQERLPLNHPRNTYPLGAKVSRKQWDDGTQTFTYNINKNLDIFIKHIFLGNVGGLQKPTSNLMEQVQLTVPLLRPLVDNNPYFFYTAKGPKGNAASTKKPWNGVPDCINDAKRQVIGRTSSFAEIPEKLICVKHMRIVAWITEGSRRGNEVIRAKNKCAILLAMGCTTMLTVTPRSLEKMKAVDSISRSNTPDNSRQDIESGWVAVDGKVDDELSTEDPGALSVPVGSRKGRGAPKKKDRPSFTLSLYHGDMVVFYGDDFEYSFKRDGTSFMMFASHDEIV